MTIRQSTALTNPPTLRKICWTCLGRWEQLPKEEQQSFNRVYEMSMTIVRLTTQNMVTPHKGCRARLEDLADALARELQRRNNA